VGRFVRFRVVSAVGGLQDVCSGSPTRLQDVCKRGARSTRRARYTASTHVTAVCGGACPNSALSGPPGGFGTNTPAGRKQGVRLVPTLTGLQHRWVGSAVDADTLAIGDEAVASGGSPSATADRPDRSRRAERFVRPLSFERSSALGESERAAATGWTHLNPSAPNRGLAGSSRVWSSPIRCPWRSAQTRAPAGSSSLANHATNVIVLGYSRSGLGTET
jgi:hypothetical protein